MSTCNLVPCKRRNPSIFPLGRIYTGWLVPTPEGLEIFCPVRENMFGKNYVKFAISSHFKLIRLLKVYSELSHLPKI